jgi:hypothetical protein
LTFALSLSQKAAMEADLKSVAARVASAPLVQPPPEFVVPRSAASAAAGETSAAHVAQVAASRGCRLAQELLALRLLKRDVLGDDEVREVKRIAKSLFASLFAGDSEEWLQVPVGDSGEACMAATCMEDLPNPIIVYPTASQGAPSSNEKDSRAIQIARDVERDTFDINGCIMRGSLGFTVIRDALVDHLVSHSRAVSWWSPPPSSQLSDFATLILRAANRTESGGHSFEVIQRIIGRLDPDIIIVPDSAAAEPLKISTSAGYFLQRLKQPVSELAVHSELADMYESAGSHWIACGILCKLAATTVYRLYRDDVESPPLGCLRATYFHRITMPLSPPMQQGQEVTFVGLDYCSDEGQIEIVTEVFHNYSSISVSGPEQGDVTMPLDRLRDDGFATQHPAPPSGRSFDPSSSKMASLLDRLEVKKPTLPPVLLTGIEDVEEPPPKSEALKLFDRLS